MADTFDINQAADDLISRAESIAKSGGIGVDNAFVPLFAAVCRASMKHGTAGFLAASMITNLPRIISCADGLVEFPTDGEEEDDGEET
ncbi:hypothetical protein [Rhodospirillum sp. A1_3_36]|uniref:hypothetical protein n=1 Tax=Rhodospirillum sp. A1_3_36 TaxID=3391666 RepID=UPI0039A5772B